MTQRQRRAKAQRAGARRRKINAAVVAWRKMNPGKKLPDAVRVKRLTGGGFSITPVKMNAGPFSFRKTKKRFKAAAARPHGVRGTRYPIKRLHKEAFKAYLKTKRR